MVISSSQTDFVTNVRRALSEIDENYNDYKGIVITGSHQPEDIEEKIGLIKLARTQKIPFLGICMGMQLMAIEFARNVLGIKDATSQEIGEGAQVVIQIPNQKLPRVGLRQVTWPGDENNKTMESHWHNYCIHPQLIGFMIDKHPWEISGSDDGIVEIMKLHEHPFFWGVQFHPEYQNSKDKPHYLLKEFIEICKKETK